MNALKMVRFKMVQRFKTFLQSDVFIRQLFAVTVVTTRTFQLATINTMTEKYDFLFTLFQKYFVYCHTPKSRRVALILFSNVTQHDLFGFFVYNLEFLFKKPIYSYQKKMCVFKYGQETTSHAKLHIADFEIDNNEKN